MSEQAASAKAKAETSKLKGTSKKQSDATKASLNLQELRELAELVNEHGFTDFEFENENIRIRLSKNAAPQFVQALQPVAPSAPQTASQQPASAPQTAAVGETSAETAVDADEGLYKITSPIVGTFYRSPSPDKPPYVQEGDKVSESSVVCIVEAMKLMNEIQAETSGEVVKIYVENGQPVEYGQPLFGIRK
ncbi:MAG TPA: acetyl-CoA carboxylase biotin carboxyl carrier protein [Pyrinomonadaceae bacterium]|jgi:acetyl-CoA carboxylase biotin carboxyl carrier protein